MAENLKETLLGDEADGSGSGSSRRGLNSFEALKGSLQRLTDTWQRKQQVASQGNTGFIKGDTRAEWRKKLAERLESTSTHVFIVALLLVDLLATCIDILKTIHNKTSDLDSCSVLLTACQCVGHFEETKSWEFVYWISIVILSILALNVVLLLVAFGRYFFKQPGYILDLFVIGTALLLEIFLDTDTVGLLIILSIWRIVRVAHGIFEVTDEAWEKEMKQFEKRLKDAEARHETDAELLQEKDYRIAELERVVAEK